jgi:hypothetical protein
METSKRARKRKLDTATSILKVRIGGYSEQVGFDGCLFIIRQFVVADFAASI